MKTIPTPSISDAGDLIPLAGRVLLPRRFTAHFSGTPDITLVIEIRDGRPVVTEVHVTCAAGVGHPELRMPIASRYLPKAVAEAATTLVAESANYPVVDLTPAAPGGTTLKLPGGTTAQDLALLGRMIGKRKGTPPAHGDHLGRGRYVLRQPQQEETYAQAAGLKRGPGRPRRVPDHEELCAISETYNSRQSIADVMSAHFLTRPTARRRIAEARAAGLVPERTARRTPPSRAVEDR